jgi:cytohesin
VDVNPNENDSDFTPLHNAVRYGYKEVAKLLITNGAIVNVPSPSHVSYDTPLYIAASKGYTELIRFMISKGTWMRNMTIDEHFRYAAIRGDKKVVEILIITNGVDVNAHEGGWTALNRAAFSGRKEIVEVLLANGADINTKTIEGKTALDIAIKEGHQEIVDLLRKYESIE